MVDATILVPTYRHTRLLPIALASALDQVDVAVEVLVVGDGVEDATRDVVTGLAHDPRVRLYDYPKGPRNGEAYRHEVLAEARGRIVTYLCDDDLLLRDHVATMLGILEDADFAHPPATRFVGDELQFFPWSYARSQFREVGRVRKGSMGLTGAAHTLAAYRRLPHGWRTTPAGLPTDHFMWLQWLDTPGMRFATSDRDARTDSPTYGRLNVFHLGGHDRALLSIPAGVYHAVCNVGADEGAFVNLPSHSYQHDDPDKYRLPLDNDVIPYRL